jgi:hypothetical protein
MNLRRAFVVFLCAALAPLLSAADLYVSPAGRDTWSGRLAAPAPAGDDGPFATLERARDELRRRRAAGATASPTTIHVRAGRYALARPLRLEAADSGTVAAPVEWRGYRDERPLLHGGRTVTAWQPHEGKILRADLGAQGLSGVDFRMLLCDGRQQILARYPNFDPANPYGGGWAYVEGKYVPMYSEIPGEDKRTFRYAAADDRAWARPEEAEVLVFPRYNWWNNLVRVATRDRATRTIQLAADCSYAIRPGDRYYVRNVREELDAPGEWYLDRATATLYFWPPDGADLATVSAPVLRSLLELAPGTAHVTFRGFVLEGCEGTAVTFKGTTACRLVACTVRHVGDYHHNAVDLDGGTANGVVGCDLHHVGRSRHLARRRRPEARSRPREISPKIITSITPAASTNRASVSPSAALASALPTTSSTTVRASRFSSWATITSSSSTTCVM